MKQPLSPFRRQGEGAKSFSLHSCIAYICVQCESLSHSPGQGTATSCCKIPLDGAEPRCRVHTVGRAMRCPSPRFNTLHLPSSFRSLLADLSHPAVAGLFLVIYSGVLQSSQRSAEPMLNNIDLQDWKPGGLRPAKSCVLCRQEESQHHHTEELTEMRKLKQSGSV